MSHILQFLLFIVLSTAGKSVADARGFVAPDLSAWEIAALLHLLVVAFGTLDNEKIGFVSPQFERRIKQVILGGCGAFLFLKMAIVFLETKQRVEGGGLQPLVSLAPSVAGWAHALEALTPYVIVMPLFFFLLINVVLLWHVSRQATRLGFTDAYEVRHLRDLIYFVDLPVVVPFSVLWIYLILDPLLTPELYPLGMGLVGCCLLVVSNVAAGVFSDQRRDPQLKIRR